MKASILIFVIVLSSIALKAQYRPTPEQLATEKVNSLKSSLSLSPEQTEKVKGIYMAQFKSRDSLITVINKRTPNQEARNAAFTSAFNKQELETDQKINSVLNNEQKVRYGKYISSRQPGRIVSVRSTSPRR